MIKIALALGAFVGSRWPFLLRRGFWGVIGKSQSSNHRVHHKNKSGTEGAPQKKEWIGGCSKKKKQNDGSISFFV